MPQEGTNDNSAGDLTPWEATRVIIVDDDHRRAQDTQLLLQFVGEPARVIAFNLINLHVKFTLNII